MNYKPLEASEVNLLEGMRREIEKAPQRAHLSPEGQFLFVDMAVEKSDESNLVVYNYTRILKLCQESLIGSILIHNDAIGFGTTMSRDELVIALGMGVPDDSKRRRVNAMIEEERKRGVAILTPPGASGFCIPSSDRWEMELRIWAKSSLKRGCNILDPIKSVMNASFGVYDGQSLLEEFCNG